MNVIKKEFLLILIFILISNSLLSGVKVNIAIKGWDNELLYPARIELNQVGDTNKKVFYNSNDKKDFTLDLESDEFYFIRFSGINHLTDSLLLFLPENEDKLTLVVKLEPIKLIKPPVPTITFKGEKNDSQKFFKKISDNLYEIEIQTVPGKQVCYEVGGVHLNRFINGTFGETYLYDGGGDWWSCFEAKDKRTKITLELDKYPKAWNDFYFFVDDLNVEKTISFYRNSLKVRNKILNFIRMFKQPIENLPDTLVKQVSFYMQSLKTSWEKHQNNNVLANLIFLDYLTFSFLLYKYNASNYIDKDFLKKVYEVVPPNSKLWLDFAEQPGLVLAGLLILNAPDSVEYVDRVLTSNPSEYIKTKLARDAVDLYFGILGRLDLGEKYFSYLIRNYPNSSEAQYVIRNYPKLNLDSLYLFWKNVISDYVLQPVFSKEKINLFSFAKEKKFILLEIWATWCAPCLKQIPVLTEAFKRYNEKLAIISISFDNNLEILKQFIQKKQEKGQMLWFQAVEPLGFSSPLAKSLSLKGIPFSLLLDDNLNIIATSVELNEFNLLTTLEKLLK